MNPYLAAALAISLDYGSTKYALSQGAIERNPIMHSHMEAKRIAQIALVGYGLSRIEKKNKPLAKKVKIGLFVVNGIIAGHNIHQGRKMR